MALNSSSGPLARPASTVSLAMLVALIAVVGLLGGSARPDMIQLALLRPLTGVLFCAALYLISRDQLTAVRPLLWILGLFVFWTTLQLVPLPPAIWQSLPGRGVIAQIDQAAGLGQQWRPLSFTPSRGLNALLSLIVPAAALLLALAVNAKPRLLFGMIAALGLLDALVGLLQIAGGRSSPLYMYAITNQGLPVGIFANENHSAAFSAIVLLLIARLSSTSKAAKEPVWMRIVYGAAYLVVLLTVLVSGSRAGLAMSLLAVLVSASILMLSFTGRRKTAGSPSKVQVWVATHPRAILALFAGVLVCLIGTFASLERSPAMRGLISEDPLDDLRWRALPIFEQMISNHWLFGTGFGSFDKVFLIYEPTNFLKPVYFNQAHNDWAQLIIEGGLPAALILGALLMWIARAVWALARNHSDGLSRLLFWGAVFAILCAASVVDYPLRTPIFQLVGIWLLLILAIELAKLPQKQNKASKS